MTGNFIKFSLFMLGFWVPVLLAESLPAGTGKEAELQDPTLMTQSFREALTRMAQAKGTGNTGAVVQPVLPEIRLMASLLGNDAGLKSTTLLKIGDKTFSARENDIITVFSSAKTQLDVELQVIEIHKYFVKLMMISPINKTLILR